MQDNNLWLKNKEEIKIMDIDIDEKTYEEIAAMIHSEESPVGIDAKKTHIYILYKLNQIEKRLEAIEGVKG